MDESKGNDTVVMSRKDIDVFIENAKPLLKSAKVLPDFLLVTGLPGCGKTTTLRMLEAAWGTRVVVISGGNAIRDYLRTDTSSMSNNDRELFLKRASRIKKGMSDRLVNADDVHFVLEKAITDAWIDNPRASVVLDGVPRSKADLVWIKERIPELYASNARSIRTGKRVAWFHLTVPETNAGFSLLAQRISTRDSTKGQERMCGTTDMTSALARVHKEHNNAKELNAALGTMDMEYITRMSSNADSDCGTMLMSIARIIVTTFKAEF